MKQFTFTTSDGRNMVWAAVDQASLEIELTTKGYVASGIEEYTEPLRTHTVQYNPKKPHTASA